MTDDGRPAARRIATPQNWALLVWFMIFLGAFTNGAGSIIGVVTAHLMVKRLSETIYGSHMTSAVRTFWVGFGGAVIGALALEDTVRQESRATVQALRARKILIDGKKDAILLQIFSENQLGPIFFEFIQRKGDDGFGNGNFKALFESMELDQMRRGVLKK